MRSGRFEEEISLAPAANLTTIPRKLACSLVAIVTELPQLPCMVTDHGNVCKFVETKFVDCKAVVGSSEGILFSFQFD
jgi:hypothetical protein